VAVPPLDQRVLDAGEEAEALAAEHRDRDRQVVAEVEHRDRHDEGKVEPVRHIDVRLLAPHQRAQEDEQVDDPDDRQPDVRVPFRLGVFASLGHAHQIASRGDDDEEVVAPEDEPGRDVAGKPGAAGALHDVEGRRDQRVAAHGEDHTRGVDRAQATEIDEGKIPVQDRKGELARDVEAGEHARNGPEERRDDAVLHDLVIVALAVVSPRTTFERTEVPRANCHDRADESQREDPGVNRHGYVDGFRRDDQTQECAHYERQNDAVGRRGHCSVETTARPA
jgi:hypothetical protein